MRFREGRGGAFIWRDLGPWKLNRKRFSPFDWAEWVMTLVAPSPEGEETP
jgi:hypothetical protein